MKNASRRGLFHLRATTAQAVLVCLVALAAVLFSPPVCPAANDYPLTRSGALPAFTAEGRYNVEYAGKSLAASGNAKLSLDLPGQPIGAFLYLAGIDSQRRGGISKVKVVITDGLGRTHKITRVPVVYAARSGRGNFVNRVEITPFLSQGKNTIAISGYKLQIPEGAFAYAVTPAGPETPMKLFQA
jgi:hypothetical protein